MALCRELIHDDPHAADEYGSTFSDFIERAHFHELVTIHAGEDEVAAQNKVMLDIKQRKAKDNGRIWLAQQRELDFGSCVVHGFAFVITNHGQMGFGAQIAQPGDIVCVFYGSRLPYHIRPADEYYKFLGSATYMA